MGWVRETAPPPSNAEMLKRDYVADRITLEQYEEALGIMLEDGTADDMAPRDWIIGGPGRSAYLPLTGDCETR